MPPSDGVSSTARHRRDGSIRWRPDAIVSPRTWLIVLAAYVALAGLCLAWIVCWNATESSASCTVSDVHRSRVNGRGAPALWIVDTTDCGRLTISSPRDGSRIAPSAVQPGSRYELSLHGWDVLSHHRQIIDARRIG